MTLEDLLEEIVGEIRDECDVEVEPVVEEADGTFVTSAARLAPCVGPLDPVGGE